MFRTSNNFRPIFARRADSYKVVLIGAGGDELLAGYFDYFYPIIDYLRKHNRNLPMVENLFLTRSLWPKYCARKRLRILRGLLANNDQCIRQHNPFTFFNRSGIANGEKYLKDKQLKDRVICRKETFPNTYHELSVGYLSGWLMNYWLRNGDRAHLGVPVETRRPFLDYRLVDYVLTLPPEYLLNRGWTKYILRKSFEDIVPKEAIWNRQKRGMPFNTLEWFSHAKPIIQRHLLSVQDNPFLDVTAVMKDYDGSCKAIHRCSGEMSV